MYLTTDPTAVAMERLYSDGSGVEFGVRFDANDRGDPHSVEIECQAGNCRIPVAELDWFIAALRAAREVAEANAPKPREIETPEAA